MPTDGRVVDQGWHCEAGTVGVAGALAAALDLKRSGVCVASIPFKFEGVV